MRKKWLSLILVSFFVVNIYVTVYFVQVSEFVNDSNMSTKSGESLVKWAWWTDVAEFEAWQIIDAFTTWVDTGDQLYARCYNGEVGSAKRDFKNTPGDLLRNYSIYVRFDSPDEYQYVFFRVYYTDASYEQIYYYERSGGSYPVYIWINGSFDSSKTIDYLFFEMESHAGFNNYVRILDEIYWGMPNVISNMSYSPAGLGIGIPIEFSCILNYTFDTFAYLFLYYQETGKTSPAFQLSADWTQDSYFNVIVTFNRTGNYLFYIFLTQDYWDYEYTSQYVHMEVGVDPYPRESYLSLYSSLTGFPLESKDYKIYVGEDEERSLVDFRDYWGNWTRLFETSDVGARFVDNYIEFSATKNGLATRFEEGAIWDTLIFSTLLFEIKVDEPTTLVIIYNPEFHEKDYYVQFTSAMTDLWYSVSVNIFNFTVYKDVTHNLLTQLGFYIYSGRIQLSNIRLAMDHDAEFQLTTYNYSENQIVDRTLNSANTWNNQSANCFETNFNVTNFQGENITIANNETVIIADSGHFPALFSFENDTDEEIPNNWTVIEPDPLTKTRVTSAQNEHVKVVYQWDDTGVFATSMYNTFDVIDDSSIEFWVQFEKATTEGWKFYLYESSTHCIYIRLGVVEIGAGNLGYYDGSWHTICALTNNFWYHMKLDFDKDNGWQIEIDGTQYGSGYSYGYYNTPSNGLTKILFSTDASGAGAGAYYYYDAIDYSWADGYYTYRNYNNTYFSDAFYRSPSYNLGVGTSFYYTTLDWSRFLGTETNITLNYRVSSDNSTWDAWSEIHASNVTLNWFGKQYFQFQLNLTSAGNYTDSPECYWVNLSYNLNRFECVMNHTEVMEFEYNESYYLYSTGIYNVTLNLIVNNETAFELRLFNFSSDSYQQISSKNYTNEWISPDFHNLTHFYVNFSSFALYAFSFHFYMNVTREYYEIWNETSYSSKDYRLISEANRQNPNQLTFSQQERSIAVLDHFNNVLYRKTLNWSDFIDIGIPICTLTVINNKNYTIVAEIQRGLGVSIQIAIPANSFISIKIFATSYRVEIRNLQMQLLDLTSISPNSSQVTTIQFGETQEMEVPELDFWKAIWDFFFGTWYGILLFIFIVAALVVLFANFFFNIFKWRNKRKRRKRSAKQERISQTLKNFGKEAEA